MEKRKALIGLVGGAVLYSATLLGGFGSNVSAHPHPEHPHDKCICKPKPCPDPIDPDPYMPVPVPRSGRIKSDCCDHPKVSYRPAEGCGMLPRVRVIEKCPTKCPCPNNYNLDPCPTPPFPRPHPYEEIKQEENGIDRVKVGLGGRCD